MQYIFFKQTPKKAFFFLGVLGFVVILDQFLKHKIRQGGEFFVCNKGISFGIQLPNIFFWLIIALFFLLSLAFCVFLYKKKAPLQLTTKTLLSIALLIGGTLSNLIDRLLIGCVLDYIALFKPFPVFNFADVGIFLGSCFIIFFLLSKNKPCG